MYDLTQWTEPSCSSERRWASLESPLERFGAHALRARLSPEMLGVFETGVRYQMYHVFAVLIVAVAIGNLGNARLLVAAGWLFAAGILVFSGSRMPWPSPAFGR